MMTYEEGRQARRDGKARLSNPYLAGTALHAWWDEGWSDSDTMLRALGVA
jgi:hypothetical protein